MEKLDTLTMIFSHHLWANLLLLDRCGELTDEQLDTSVPGTYGTIRDTLHHIVRSEQSYFSRISTGKRHPFPEKLPQMKITELKETAQKTGSGLINWATKVQAEDKVTIDWDGTPRDVPKTIILTQVINHATEHRSQVMTIMTQLGIEPPDLQSWVYFDELKD